MKKTEEKKKTVKIIKYYCDVCGKEVRTSLATHIYKCMICDRDICEKDTYSHYTFESGDYPDRYCYSCWNAGESYRKEIEILEEELEHKKAQLEDRWIEEAKKNLQ